VSPPVVQVIYLGCHLQWSRVYIWSVTGLWSGVYIWGVTSSGLGYISGVSPGSGLGYISGASPGSGPGYIPGVSPPLVRGIYLGFHLQWSGVYIRGVTPSGPGYISGVSPPVFARSISISKIRDTDLVGNHTPH
jgi:hypothetical protein